MSGTSPISCLDSPSIPSICKRIVADCKLNTSDEILMITILGAGGAIGNELVKLLAAKNQPFRLVGRNPKATPGATETLAADVTDGDQAVRAVVGSSVVHLLVGLKYDRRVWQDMRRPVTR
jgi:uncharacterized protein YbjT (DUF2867 family)